MSYPAFTTPQHSLEERARLYDQAVADAHELRREAIDDFWRGANGMLGASALRAQRAALKLAQRLRRRPAGGGTAMPAGMA